MKRIEFEGIDYMVDEENDKVIITATDDGCHIEYDSLDSFYRDANAEGIENLSWKY
jgi:hypothetical protein